MTLSINRFNALHESCEAALDYPKNLLSERYTTYTLEGFFRRLQSYSQSLFLASTKDESKIAADFWEFGDEDKGTSASRLWLEPLDIRILISVKNFGKRQFAIFRR